MNDAPIIPLLRVEMIALVDPTAGLHTLSHTDAQSATNLGKHFDRDVCLGFFESRNGRRVDADLPSQVRWRQPCFEPRVTNQFRDAPRNHRVVAWFAQIACRHPSSSD